VAGGQFSGDLPQGATGCPQVLHKGEGLLFGRILDQRDSVRAEPNAKTDLATRCRRLILCRGASLVLSSL